VPEYFIASAGTGGTISGVARKFKELTPECKIIGVDPVGSLLGGGTDVSNYQVEGIGYDFFPKVLDLSLIDEWVKTTDGPSFLMARRAIREEGLLCGGSSGSALCGVEAIINSVPPKSTLVVVLADGIRNYMSKMMDNEWLLKNNFSDAVLPHVVYSK
jgi:cysteine synthase